MSLFNKNGSKPNEYVFPADAASGIDLSSTRWRDCRSLAIENNLLFVKDSRTEIALPGVAFKSLFPVKLGLK